MSNRLLLGIVAGLVVAVLLYYAIFHFGATPVKPPANGTGSATGTGAPRQAEKPAAPNPEPLLEGWKQPALAIVLSGEQHGYLEPCGCSLTQLGGMSRRDDLLRQIFERGWPLTAVDVGGLIKFKFKGRKQTQFKFEAMQDALKNMKYAALGLGPEELGLDPLYLLSLQRPEYPPFLSANVVLLGSPDTGVPLPRTVLTVGNVKLGIAADFGNSLKNEVLPVGQDQNQSGDLKVIDPKTALPPVIAALQNEKPDLLVLLSHAKLDESKELAKSFPEFDLILTAGGPEDPDKQPLLIGKTMLAMVGAKGKHVGVVGFYPDNQKQRLRFELVDLDDKRFKNSPRMEKLMRFYQERLKDENLAAKELAIDHPTGAEFVGAAKCGVCHTKAYAKWKESKHAQALEHLKTGRKGQEATWISRIFDPECLACHVTGWNPQEVLRYKSGYVDEKTSPQLLGQQCENCHGPGSRHVEEEERWKKAGGKLTDELLKWRKSQHLDLELAKTVERGCYRCHDLDNSPEFKSETFDKYWEKIKHPGRD